MKIAQLFDQVHPSAGPYFSAQRGHIDDPAERERVAGFLRRGGLVLYTDGKDKDWVDPRQGRSVPMSFRTDGAWLWNDGLEYYVRLHGVAPDPDFYQHIRDSDYTCPEVSQPTRERALEALYAARDAKGG
jgi:hypothetical protein